jgi:SAM-dependent methyltransferase
MIPGQCRSEADYVLYLRHLFAYQTAADLFRGTDVVLDIGCGAGYGTRLLADRVRMAVGVDVALAALTHGAAVPSQRRCSFLQYDGRRLPFANATFDGATSFQTLEHVLDDVSFVEEAARLLKPGSVFVVTTPNRLTRLSEGQRPWNRFHVREYSPVQLEDLLAERFGSVEVLAVRASASIERLESERVARARQLDALDVFAVRRRLPAWLLGSLARLRTATPASEVHWSHRVNDFFATGTDRHLGLDLLAVCRR